MRSWFDSIGDNEDVGDISRKVDEAASELEGTDFEARNLSEDAIESGFFESEDKYYDLLHQVALELSRTRVKEASESPDRDLIHAIRSIETIDDNLNELDERVRDWREDLEGRAETRIPEEVESLESAVEELEETRSELTDFIEKRAWEVAPNLTNLSDPILASRLIALAGGLESLAKMPSSTVQVLGAEDALFRHLQSDAPSPKHGVIYLHPYVRSTSPEKRGRASRTLAGKLTIGARIDYYSGDLRQELADELDEKIERIREE